MITTLIICLSIITIVIILCYTDYKIRTYKVDEEVLKEIKTELFLLKHNTQEISDKFRYTSEELKEIKKHLQNGSKKKLKQQ